MVCESILNYSDAQKDWDAEDQLEVSVIRSE
jgi:hypothetical protein